MDEEDKYNYAMYAGRQIQQLNGKYERTVIAVDRDEKRTVAVIRDTATEPVETPTTETPMMSAEEKILKEISTGTKEMSEAEKLMALRGV